ncbi:MAG TPA: sodium:solute symporter family protein, partial [Burkholderiaceae bacterium]|nr:sodium:solute symporter family protein [Burkholderiaceae bacterium]
ADFAVAGRAMPFYVVTATVFATWFGSETVLGIPATFLKENLRGVIADPFGSSLCLILVGLFFAVPLYRQKLLTIGDYYRGRYNRTVEVVTSLAIVVSYLGWVGAQIKALGLVFNVVSNDAISTQLGMLLGAASVLVYTLFGGMVSVAITDLVQMVVIVIGMLYIGWDISDRAGGVTTVIQHAAESGKFEFWPEMNVTAILGFFAAWITMMFGSIPQQDVFQRVMSSKTAKIAMWASVLGGVLYFGFAFVPMFLAYSATLIDAPLVAKYLEQDSQLILPKLIINHAPVFAQIMFFGALLSAIKSCASATLLAPSITFAENILKPMFPAMDDRKFLRLMRSVVLGFTALVLVYALNTEASIFKMVENAYQVTLVSAFVPLVAGVYWKRANALGGMLSMFAGLIVWIGMLIVAPDAAMPPQLAGVLASAVGMVAGSYWPSRQTSSVTNPL